MERATVTTSSFTKKQGFSSHRDYNRRSAWIWQRTYQTIVEETFHTVSQTVFIILWWCSHFRKSFFFFSIFYL